MNRTNLEVLLICGSLRRRSYNRALLSVLPDLAPDDMSFVRAGELDLPIYNDDVLDAAGIPEGATQLAEQIGSASGVVIASPEYNQSVGAPLKNAIDWLSMVEKQPFRHKPVAVMSASTGMLGGSRGQSHLRQILNSMDAYLLSKPEVLITHAGMKFDELRRFVDEPGREMVRTQLTAFREFVLKFGS